MCVTNILYTQMVLVMVLGYQNIAFDDLSKTNIHIHAKFLCCGGACLLHILYIRSVIIVIFLKTAN